MYSSLVSIDGMQIAFMITVLNDIDVHAAKIGNIYLNASCQKNIWTVTSTEFVINEGITMIVIRDLYIL